jgi:uracil-DNA glycosylase family 4
MTESAAHRSLERLAQEIRNHRGCGFEPCETCTNPVPGEGPAPAEVMLVGEAPGKQEDESGRPFVGSAGRFLDRLLETAGLDRQHVFITNVLKARPPNNRSPKAAEVAHSRPWLERQVELVDPLLVVPLGRHAVEIFLPGRKITQSRGQLALAGGRAVYPTLHPSAAVRVEALRHQIRDDFTALAEALEWAREHVEEVRASTTPSDVAVG